MTEPPSVTDWLSAIAAVLQTVVAMVAVLLAWLGARAWREQLRTTKQSEVAGEMLAATLGYIFALQRMAGVFERTSDQIAERKARWTLIAEDERVFLAARGRAIAYLPDQSVALVEEVWKRRWQLYSDQLNWARPLGEDDDLDSAKRLYHRSFGTEIEGDLRNLETRAIQVLKPLARAESTSK